MTAPGTGERAAGEVGVREVVERIGAEQHEQVDARRRPRPTRMPAASRPPSCGREAELRARRRRCRAAAPAAPWRPGRRRARSCSARGGRRGRLGEVGAPGDDDDRARRAAGRRSSCSASAACSGADRAGLDPDAAPGVAGQAGVGRASISMILHRALLGGVAQPQEQDRQLLLEVGPEQDDRRRLRRLVDRRPRAGRARPAGRPSPSWASRCGDADGVGERGPGEGVLVRAPGAAEDGDAPRPAAGRAPRATSWAAASRATLHDVSASPPSPRTSGAVRRSSAVRRLEVEAAAVAQPAPVDRRRSRRRGSARARRATTARRCGSRRCTPCTCSRPARGPTAGP